MRIGEMARECGVNPKTIRYYEAFGLLPRPARAASGHRIYSSEDLDRLRFIRRAKRIGLPLHSIRQITKYADTGTCQHLRPRLGDLVTAQLVVVEEQIRELRALARELRRHQRTLSQPATQSAGVKSCSCLDSASQDRQVLPGAALVRRPTRR